jgi:itaconyl-CoA hydratase
MQEPIGAGRYFEDFSVGDHYQHPLGRTITATDNSWFTLLTMNTHQLHFNDDYAAGTEFGRQLVNSGLSVAMVLGLSVSDVSQHAVANLGWTDIELPHPLFVGDTLYAESVVTATRASESRPEAGIVFVKTRGLNQDGKVCVRFNRTVLVRRRSARRIARFPSAEQPMSLQTQPRGEANQVPTAAGQSRDRQDVTMFCMCATLFDDDGSLDEAAMRAHLRRLVAAGNGIYLGSPGSGEGYSLTPRELRRVYEIGVEEAKGKVPLYANPREAHTAADAYEVAKEAVAADIDVVQLYQLDGGHGIIPTEREQEAYFTELLDELKHPAAISVHSAVGYFAPISLLVRLCKLYENIWAINIVGPSDAYFLAVRDALPPSVKMYSASRTVLQRLALGASGALLPWGNIMPNVVQQIADGYVANDLARTADAVRTLERFSSLMWQWMPSARPLKMAMKILGLGNGVLRAPLLYPPVEDEQKIARALADLRVPEIEGLDGDALARYMQKLADEPQPHFDGQADSTIILSGGSH